MKNILLDQEQMKSLKVKTSGNVCRMLQFIYQVIGSPEEKKYVLSNEHVYECYAIFTHAVEEYGKLLYLKSLEPDENDEYTIEYTKKFTDHKTKFKLARDELPKSIMVVYERNFSSDPDSSNFDTYT